MPDSSKRPHIVLIGSRGTGKTTVARLLAERLRLPWIDADDRIEEQAGKTIKKIFAEEGESSFRDLEQQVTAGLMAGSPSVLAMGGGVVLREANRSALSAGNVFWLTASAETLHARIEGDASSGERRPDLTVAGGIDEIRDIAERRRPLYEEVCDFPIDTEGKSPDEVADEILSLID